MHPILSTLAIALINNLDNVGLCAAYSLRGIRLGQRENLIIAAITFFISGAATFAGARLSSASAGSAALCRVLGAGVLIAMGLWSLAAPYISRLRARRAEKRPARRADGRGAPVLAALRDPERSDLDGSKSIDPREAALLGVSLSLNNVGGCLSAGMLGLSPALTAGLSAAASWLSLLAGGLLARALERVRLGHFAELLGGAALVALGVAQLF